MITMCLIAVGVCVCVYVVFAILSALLEWLALIAGVVGVVIVACLGWHYATEALSSDRAASNASSPAPTHHSTPRHVAPRSPVASGITNL